jgi:IclR family acetate operon transcriptional repressor
VQSVQRAAAVLNVLLVGREAMTAVELARETGIHRTNVHRLLRTLQDAGYVAEGPAGHYQLGSAMLLFGNAFTERLEVRRAALPYLVDLTKRVVGARPWVVALAIPVGTDAVLVERIWQAQAPLDSILDVGTRLPMASSAHGKAMLSASSPEEVAATIGDVASSELSEQLATSRAAGYVANSSNEFRPGVSAIAAAITDQAGRPIGSVAISGIDLEPFIAIDADLAQHLRRAADVIALRCGRGGSESHTA